jgi:hypothetical protein
MVRDDDEERSSPRTCAGEKTDEGPALRNKPQRSIARTIGMVGCVQGGVSAIGNVPRHSPHLTLFLLSAYSPRHHPAPPVHGPSCPESGRMQRPGGRGLRRRRPFRARLSNYPTAPSGMARAAGTPVLLEDLMRASGG